MVDDVVSRGDVKPERPEPAFGTSGYRRLLIAASLLYVAGWALRAIWRVGHPAFKTRGPQELVIHTPMWVAAVLVIVAGAWELAAGARERGYPIVFGAGAINLGAELWHAWAHYHHQEYGLAHGLIRAGALLGVVAVAVVLVQGRHTIDVGSSLARLDAFRLLDLTTFRRSGAPVMTPVRFALDGDRIVVSLRADSGKIKRLRSNPQVRIAGHSDGDSLNGTIRELQGSQSRAAYAALKRRYLLLTFQRFVFARHPSRHVSAEIQLS